MKLVKVDSQVDATTGSTKAEFGFNKIRVRLDYIYTQIQL